MERAWFSNFKAFEVPMSYQGMTFNTPEHFYMAMKTTEIVLRRKISNLPTPAQAKKFGRTLQLRPDWNEYRLDIMEYALRYKFGPGTKWLERLRRENGPFIELNYWHDNFWGHCICNKCKAKIHHNHLGKLIDKLQAEFI